MVNHFININKAKESLNSDGQQFYEIGTENISFISKRELQLDFKRHTSWSFDFMFNDLR
jgi:hypothetical protein